jgi:hypothetical protein
MGCRALGTENIRYDTQLIGGSSSPYALGHTKGLLVVPKASQTAGAAPEGMMATSASFQMYCMTVGPQAHMFAMT